MAKKPPKLEIAGITKSTIDIHTSFPTKINNFSLRNGCFPDELRAAEVSSIFKKMKTRKTIGLPVLCLIYQRYLKGSCIFTEDKLLKLPTRFRKNHSTQDSEKITAPRIQKKS